MKKLLLLLANLLIISAVLSAQDDFTVTPSPATASGLSTDLYIKAVASIRNNSTSTLNMNWERINVNVPSAWENSVCDPIKCHIPTLSGTGFELDPGVTGTMSVWFIPNGQAGTGEVQILIWSDTDSLNNHLINTYSVVASPPTSSEDLLLNDYTVSPNPANTFINLPKDTDAHSLVIFDIAGKELINLPIANESTFNIDFLQKGTYILQFENEDRSLRSSRQLVKL